MTRSEKSSVRLTELDDLVRPEYRYLRPEDRCFALGEYTAGMGYQHSDTNNWISNFKKGPETEGTSQWQFKIRAIRRFARQLRLAIQPERLKAATLVPIPPSKAENDPKYDPRMLWLLEKLQEFVAAHGGPRDLDIRRLIYQRETTDASHHRENERLKPDELLKVYEIDESLVDPAPKVVLLFDDIIATGAHFKASKQLLQDRFGSISVVGIFLARNIHADEDEGGSSVLKDILRGC